MSNVRWLENYATFELAIEIFSEAAGLMIIALMMCLFAPSILQDSASAGPTMAQDREVPGVRSLVMSP